MIEGPQNDEQYMRDLYERFRKGVCENNNSEFYDEDELLDIYDFAQDEADEMVQLYVLLTGARLFPDSDFLDERKAFFLSSVSDEAARDMMGRKGRKDSALWGVLKLSLDTYPDGNPEEGLADLLSTDHTFSCEAVIRLIDTLHDLNRDDLIAENLHIIKEKAENPTLLYYEAAEALYRNDKYAQKALELADELTQLEPFNPENWVLLAKIEFALQHASECVSAAEYAMALDPANPRARLVKGFGQVLDDGSLQNGIDELKSLLKDDPDNALAVKALAEAYSRNGKKKAALEVYSAFMTRNGGDAYVIMDILKLHPEDAFPYLETFAATSGDQERKWLEIAAQLANDNEVAEAARMLTFYNDRFKLREGMEYFLQLLYRLRLYKQYVQIFSQCCTEAAEPGGTAYGFSANAYLLLASSYLMAGLYGEAITLTTHILSDPPVANDYDEHLKWKGMQLTLTFIRNLAKDPSLIPSMSDFDPVTFQIPVK